MHRRIQMMSRQLIIIDMFLRGVKLVAIEKDLHLDDLALRVEPDQLEVIGFVVLAWMGCKT